MNGTERRGEAEGEVLSVSLRQLLNPAVVGGACRVVAFLSILPLKETWGTDLDFVD